MPRTNAPHRARPARPRRAGLLAGLACAALLLSPSARAAPKRSAPAEPAAPAGKPTPAATPQPETEPVETEPADTEPADTEPTDTEPTETEPTAETEPTDTPPAAGAARGVDPAALERIQAESRALQDELFKARARVGIVTSKLFRAKVTLQLRSNLERFYDVSDLVVSLDGAPVFSQEKGLPSAAGDLFEVYAAPGAHELTISARLVARRDATYKLRIDDTFTVLVPEDSTVSTRLVLRETGNMWRFTKRGRGRHALTAILRARAKPNSRGGRAKAKASIRAGTSRVPTAGSVDRQGARG